MKKEITSCHYSVGQIFGDIICTIGAIIFVCAILTPFLIMLDKIM
jgi:hypothetical protein